MTRSSFAALLVCSTLLAACQPPQSIEHPVRSVRTAVVKADSIAPRYELAGEIKARVESRLGFQVGGRILQRKVNLGDRVSKGAVLASIDARDLTLALQAAEARVESARANLALAQTERDRVAELFRREVISASNLDAAEAALSAARSAHEEARAQLAMQGNQKAYALLRADADGVVTGILADVGEVVAVGQPVILVAHEGQREVEVVFPEDRLAVARSASAEAALWGTPEHTWPAHLRELSAAADPVTRTFVARYGIDTKDAEFQLGQTAVIRLSLPARDAISLPTTSVFDYHGESHVWLFDAAEGVVKRHHVKVMGVHGNDLLVSGLEAGNTIVTAGVHVLNEGQKVKPLAPKQIESTPASPLIY